MQNIVESHMYEKIVIIARKKCSPYTMFQMSFNQTRNQKLLPRDTFCAKQPHGTKDNNLFLSPSLTIARNTHQKQEHTHTHMCVYSK